MKNNNNIIWNLLKRNLSKGQLIGYSIANIVGLSVILTGILFFCDARNPRDEEDQFFSNDYIVISKKVTGLGFDPVSFDEDEIKALEGKEWVKKIGKFTASQFAVEGSVNMGGRGMSTYLFFESVPDEFFDVKPRDWDFDPESRFVPIIISKDYLTLYNFGFAIPQGMPQVSEEVIGAIPLRLNLTGRTGMPEHFEAAIVGFSSRLNTIAVPQSFMDWANERYAVTEQPNPSRLILEVDQMASSSMKEYFDENEYEMAGDKEGAGKVSDFLSVVSSVVTINGLVISLLALFILLLSIYLLLQKSKEKLRNLMLLGYSPRDAGKYYERFVGYANIAITLIAIGVAFAARSLWVSPLEELGLGGASPIPMLVTSVIYLAVVTLINIRVIRSRLLSIWKQ